MSKNPNFKLQVQKKKETKVRSHTNTPRLPKKDFLEKSTIYVRGTGKKWPVSKETYALNTPIFETSTFIISSPKAADEIISRGGKTYVKGEDYIYTRGGNPTQRTLEKKLSELEEGVDSVSFSSGMAAITGIVLTTLRSGDHVICGDPVFGDTHFLFEKLLNNFQVETSFVDTSNLNLVKKAIRPNTKMIFFETPNNPYLSVTDIAKISQLAKKRGILVVVDSTIASPYLQSPLSLGADAVVHSLTKFLSGHSDSIGGAVISNNQKLLSRLRQTLFVTGGLLDPFAAWNILKGLKTLPIRMEKQCENAMKIAKKLEKNNRVVKVYYPGLKSQPTYKTAKKQMKKFGSVISFELNEGSAKKINNFFKQLKLFSLGVSFGCVESLIEQPIHMTHNQVTHAANHSTALIRLSIGIEDPKDLLKDLHRALNVL